MNQYSAENKMKSLDLYLNKGKQIAFFNMLNMLMRVKSWRKRRSSNN